MRYRRALRLGRRKKKDRTSREARSFLVSISPAGANRGSCRLASSSALARRAGVQLGSGSGRGSRSRRGRRSAFDRNRNDFATVATAVAAIATTVATAIATVATMATAMAAAALTAAAVTTAAARAGAAAALAATTVAAIARRMAAVAAIAAAATKEASVGLLLTAHEGDSNQREKDRDTQNNNTVHPRILQLLTGTSKRKNYPRCQFMRLTSRLKTERASCDLTFPARIRTLHPLSPCQALRVAKDVAIAQVRPLR
jgi:hypothetical protein